MNYFTRTKPARSDGVDYVSLRDSEIETGHMTSEDSLMDRIQRGSVPPDKWSLVCKLAFLTTGSMVMGAVVYFIWTTG